MKVHVLIIMVLIGMLSGCYKEDDIVAELGTYRRAYDTMSTDPVMKYVSQYYYKYGKLIIVDPDTVDYVFNFQAKNEMIIKPFTVDYQGKAIEHIQELFLNGYSDKTIREVFPFSIILADSVMTISWSGKKANDVMYSTNFIAFAFDKGKRDLSESKKAKLSLDYHLAFLNFCMANGRIVVPDKFYKIGESRYGKYEYGKQYTQEEAYAVGFVKVSVGYSFWEEKDYTYFTDRASDLTNFITFLLTTQQAEVTRVVTAYPAMKTKYDALVEALESVYIDYRTLGYK